MCARWQQPNVQLPQTWPLIQSSRVLLLLLLLFRFVTEDLRLHIFLPNLDNTCSTSPALSPKLLHSKPLNSLKLKKPPNSHRLNTKGPKPPNPQVGWSLPRVLHHPPKQQGSEICSGSLHSVGLRKGSLRLRVLFQSFFFFLSDLFSPPVSEV